MSETREYACHGTAFASQRDARLAMEHVKAATTPMPELMTFRCDDGHWHYREVAR